MSLRGDAAIELPARITKVILGEEAGADSADKVHEAPKGKPGTKFLKMMREPGMWNYRAYGDKL